MMLVPRVERVCVHSFLPDMIRSSGVVFDFGANRGEFAGTIASRMECTVHAIEPIPVFHPRLRNLPGVNLHSCCLAPTTREVELFVPEKEDATLYPEEEVSGSTITVPGVTLEEIIRKLAVIEVDLIKLDVEGAELPVLEQTPREILLRARQISVEFHDWQRPKTSGRVRWVKERLQRLGFFCIQFSANNGDVLFIRRDLLNPLQYAYLAYFTRNLMGLRRILNRQFERITGMDY